MAFDQATRNRLLRLTTEVRALLVEEFTRQLQNDYGMDPASGLVTPLERLGHLDDARFATARILRETLTHYQATQKAVGSEDSVPELLDRILREQAFTVLNRLAALRMAEARGLAIESLGAGYQSKGFQLYAMLAGAGLGETGQAYRAYLFSVFDELALDLPLLFDRFSPQGRLFPGENTLLALLDKLNHAEIAPLWAEDETLGWVYQYFNSREERKQMRDASAAPRTSRELAVRNQFFTPRYVVEFLTDNTLGRLWVEMTRGQTRLKDQCRYLLTQPGEDLPSRPLKDPRDLSVLDPACGSMHFGLYAFDLLETIYEEAWAWPSSPKSPCSTVARPSPTNRRAWAAPGSASTCRRFATAQVDGGHHVAGKPINDEEPEQRHFRTQGNQGKSQRNSRHHEKWHALAQVDVLETIKADVGNHGHPAKDGQTTGQPADLVTGQPGGDHDPDKSGHQGRGSRRRQPLKIALVDDFEGGIEPREAQRGTGAIDEGSNPPQAPEIP